MIPVEITELPSSGWTAVSIFTLTISCVALAVSIFTWRRSGSVVKATGWFKDPPEGPGSGTRLQIRMRNAGRSETQVVEVNLRVGRRSCRVGDRDLRLPVQLGPGAEVVRGCAADEVRRSLYGAKINATTRVAVFVRTGHATARVKMHRRNRKGWTVFFSES